MKIATLHPALQPLIEDLCHGSTHMANRPLETVPAAIIIPHERRIDVFLAEWLKVTLYCDGSSSIGYSPAVRAEEPGHDIAVEGDFRYVPLAMLLENLQNSQQVDARICVALHSLLKTDTDGKPSRLSSSSAPCDRH